MAQPWEHPAFGHELARAQKWPSSELSAQSMLPSQNLRMGRHVALSLHGNSLRRQETAPSHMDGSSSEPSPAPQSASPSQIHLREHNLPMDHLHAVWLTWDKEKILKLPCLLCTQTNKHMY